MTNKLYSQLPKTLNAGYARYKFKLVPGLKVNDEKCFGSTDYHNTTIYLDPYVTEFQAQTSLLHEILHVILDVHGLGNSDTTKKYPFALTNEKIVETLEIGLTQFKKLNPKLTKLLFN